MPSYTRNFDLDINDIELIESALRARAKELMVERQFMPEGDSDTLENIDAQLRAGEALLGRLHNQKTFYRPSEDVYVGG